MDRSNAPAELSLYPAELAHDSAGKREIWKDRLRRMDRWSVERLSLHQARTKGLIFLLLVAVLVGYSLRDQPELMHDSGVYILLAQSLVSGQGYSDVYAVGEPPHTKYPPVFPLLLAPIVYLFDLNFWAMRLFILGLGLLGLYAVFILFRRLAGGKLALTDSGLNWGFSRDMGLFPVNLIGNPLPDVLLRGFVLPQKVPGRARSKS